MIPGAAALRVSRARFSPVKTTGDLLAIRSDAYLLTDDHLLAWRWTPNGGVAVSAVTVAPGIAFVVPRRTTRQTWQST